MEWDYIRMDFYVEFYLNLGVEIEPDITVVYSALPVLFTFYHPSVSLEYYASEFHEIWLVLNVRYTDGLCPFLLAGFFYFGFLFWLCVSITHTLSLHQCCRWSEDMLIRLVHRRLLTLFQRPFSILCVVMWIIYSLLLNSLVLLELLCFNGCFCLSCLDRLWCLIVIDFRWAESFLWAVPLFCLLSFIPTVLSLGYL